MTPLWTRAVRGARLALSVGRTAVRALRGENLRLRAMALTYITLFALVPALVVVFSIVQAVTGMERIRDTLHELLISNLAVGARGSIEAYLDRFVMNAHATSAGLVGGALLVYSAVSLFQHVERAINDIWEVRRGRPLVNQLLTYWAALTVGPVLLAGSASVAHVAKGWIAGSPASGLLVRAAAVGSTCLFFTLVYLITPVTKVRLGAAAAGGLVAGLAWEIAKAGYAVVVAEFFRYHAVYGSVAAIPIFLLWLWLSWTLLLFGARVAYVVQHANVLLRPGLRDEAPAARELLAARVMLEVARAYERGERPPDAAQLASRLGAPSAPVEGAVALLRGAALVNQMEGGGFAQSRPLGRITLADVRRAVVGPRSEGAGGREARHLSGLLQVAELDAERSLAEITLESLCHELGGAPPSPDELSPTVGGPVGS